MLSPVVHASAKTGGNDNWCTPEVVLERVRKLGVIGLDPCTTSENPVDAINFLTPATDGLSLPWSGQGLVYVNPPYSRMKAWAAKIADEGLWHPYSGSTKIVALVAARPDTAWWRTMLDTAWCVAFWRGRLKFKGAPSPAPFPSALFFYNIPVQAVRTAFGDVCDLMVKAE